MALSREDLDHLEAKHKELWDYRIQLASLNLRALRKAMYEVTGTDRLEDMSPHYRLMIEEMIKGIAEDYSEVNLTNIEELHETIRRHREGEQE